MKTTLPFVFAMFVVFMAISIKSTEADGYGHGHGHGHGHSAKGTACIVKGSYCNCHYCKCEKGHVHCGGYGKGGYGEYLMLVRIFPLWNNQKNVLIAGKKYCYGSTQGEYCHCDYCKCKHGYGSTGYGHCHWTFKNQGKQANQNQVKPKKNPLAGMMSRWTSHLTSMMRSLFSPKSRNQIKNSPTSVP